MMNFKDMRKREIIRCLTEFQNNLEDIVLYRVETMKNEL